jgi:hypothetical protein
VRDNRRSYIVAAGGAFLALMALAIGLAKVSTVLSAIASVCVLPSPLLVVLNVTTISLDSGRPAGIAESLSVGAVRLVMGYLLILAQLMVMALTLFGIAMAMLFVGLEAMMRGIPPDLVAIPLVAAGLIVPHATWYLMVGALAGRDGVLRGLFDAVASAVRAPGRLFMVQSASIALGVAVATINQRLRALESGHGFPTMQSALEPSVEIAVTLALSLMLLLFLTVWDVILVRPDRN